MHIVTIEKEGPLMFSSAKLTATLSLAKLTATLSSAMLIAVHPSTSYALNSCQDIVNSSFTLKVRNLKNLTSNSNFSISDSVVLSDSASLKKGTSILLFVQSQQGPKFLTFDLVHSTITESTTAEGLAINGDRGSISRIAVSNSGQSFAAVNSTTKEVRIFKSSNEGFQEVLAVDYAAKPKGWPYSMTPPPGFLPDFFVHENQVYQIGLQTTTAYSDSLFRVGRVLERGLANEPIRLLSKTATALMSDGSKTFSFSSLGKDGVQLDVYDLTSRIREEPIYFSRQQIPHEYNLKTVARLANGNLLFVGLFGTLMLDSKLNFVSASDFKKNEFGNRFGSIETVAQDNSRIAFIARPAQKIGNLSLIQLKWQNLHTQSSTLAISNVAAGKFNLFEMGEPIERVLLGAQDTVIVLTKFSVKVLSSSGRELFSRTRNTDLFGQPLSGTIVKLSEHSFAYLSREDENFVMNW